MVPKIALIHQDIYNKLLQKMLDRTKKLKAALPSDPQTTLSPVAKIQEYFEFLNDALEKSAQILYGGQRINYLNQEDENGFFIRPCLLKIVDQKKIWGMKLLKEEIFFPLLPLVKISGKDDKIFEEIINLTNSHEFGLRISLWISSPKYLRKFAKELDNCGLLRINSRHIGFSPYLSTHGGTKKSGGPFGEMNYIWQKTSHLQGISRVSKY
jgi:acyl-CoA reductase-like NAD-dependent aldehyde dehydrogenase